MSGTPQDAGIAGEYWPATVFVDLPNDERARVFTDGAVPVSLSGEVAVRLPADAGELAMLRALAETLMLTADFTIDVVTDVRVALDEVATALIAASQAASGPTTRKCTGSDHSSATLSRFEKA
ncbi:hypothetical protein [Nocardia sp. NPDC004711]